MPRCRYPILCDRCCIERTAIGLKELEIARVVVGDVLVVIALRRMNAFRGGNAAKVCERHPPRTPLGNNNCLWDLFGWAPSNDQLGPSGSLVTAGTGVGASSAASIAC